MLVRRVVGVLALTLMSGWLTVPAAAPAEAPRELHLVVGTPSSDHFTLRAVADDWAAGHRVVLQRRRSGEWTKVASSQFSPAGKARWQVPVPERRAAYRAVTRVGGERIVSTEVHFSSR